MRISIIGLPGSGKSTLAYAIHEKLSIPYLHIDRLWFDANGHLLPAGESKEKEQVRAIVRKRVAEFVQQDKWVSDGWFRSVQPLIATRTDEIIFLDISISRRLLNHVYRMFFTARHKELSKWDDLKFMYQIVRRTFVHGPRIRKFIEENKSKVKVFRSYSEVDEYLKNLCLREI